jgi:hypothetical protein
MREVLHLEFAPSSLAWIGGLQARMVNSSSQQVRERYQAWASVGLGEFALAIATRLAIIRRVEDRLLECRSALVRELSQSGKLETHLASESCYRPSDEGLLFDIYAAVDSCFFEWRSLYEVVRKFVTIFGKEILRKEISEAQVVSVIEQAGISISWIDQLRKDRNHFVHQAAPWIALEITSREPLGCSIVVMKENLATLEDVGKFVTEVELIETSNRLRESVIIVRNWLEAQIMALEATIDGGAG